VALPPTPTRRRKKRRGRREKEKGRKASSWEHRSGPSELEKTPDIFFLFAAICTA
jgi:hypothetical protein